MAGLYTHPNANAGVDKLIAMAEADEHKLETREQWLHAFIDAAKPKFEEAGFPLPPNIRASIGFPSTGSRGKRIGECWGTTSSSDGHFEIFISPALNEGAPRVADVLTHELVHAAVGLDHNHDKVFKQCATSLGLTGRMTATEAGPEWRAWAEPVLEKLGPLPGAYMDITKSGRKKQTTRLIKCECGHCGLVFRTTRQWIDRAEEGLICPIPECAGDMIIN